MTSYKKIYEKAVKVYQKDPHFTSGPHDETYFSLRVFETAKKILSLIEKEVDKEIDKEAILVAAILHDIGKITIDSDKLFDLDLRRSYLTMSKEELKPFREDWKRHPDYSVPLARKILEEENFTEEKMNKILFLIKNHANHKDFEGEKSLELQILQDADIIADMGISGFIRGFLYAGKFRVPTIEQITFMQGKSRMDFIEEFNLKISEGLAKEEAKREEELNAQMFKLLDSELLT